MNNIGEQGAKVLGFHLEGPFLNPSKVEGAKRRFIYMYPQGLMHFDEFVNQECIG